MREKARISRLGDMLGGLAASREWRDRLAQHRIFLVWPELVGEELAAVCRPEVIRDETLWVRVTDPVWGQQLQFEKNALLETINHHLQSERKVKELRFRFDPALAGELEREQEWQPEPEPPPRAVDPAREQKFARLIAGVDDPQARANLLRLWRKTEENGR